jgi:hypothetical protein
VNSPNCPEMVFSSNVRVSWNAVYSGFVLQ